MTHWRDKDPDKMSARELRCEVKIRRIDEEKYQKQIRLLKEQLSIWKSEARQLKAEKEEAT